MSAIDLRGTNSYPRTYEADSVGTALQAFLLPSGTRFVTIKTTADAWVQWTGTDGGAVDPAARYPQGANAGERWDIRPFKARRDGGIVYVAAQSGTTTVYLVIE